jgi:hypothetical protein
MNEITRRKATIAMKETDKKKINRFRELVREITRLPNKFFRIATVYDIATDEFTLGVLADIKEIPMMHHIECSDEIKDVRIVWDAVKYVTGIDVSKKFTDEEWQARCQKIAL